MLKKLSFGTTSVIVALVLALGSAVTAFAITIVVDGDQEAVWTTGSGGQTPGVTTDGDETGIANNSDIRNFRWTNDTSNMYFLVETWASPINTFHTWTLICLDVDNNATTGSTSSSPYYDQCNSQTGFEYFVYTTSSSRELDDENGNPILGATVQSAMSTVEEISVALVRWFISTVAILTPMTTRPIAGLSTSVVASPLQSRSMTCVPPPVRRTCPWRWAARPLCW